MERQLEELRLNDDQMTRGSALSQICDRCKHYLDVDGLIDRRLQAYCEGRDVMLLGEAGKMSFETSCPACLFVHSLAPKSRLPKSLRLYAEYDPLARIGGTVKENQPFLAVPDNACSPLFHIFTRTGFVFPISRNWDQECPVQVVDRSTISYDRITKMLRGCAANHRGSCNQANKTKYPLQLYVLDCLGDTIAPLCPGDQYVALSYVWGMPADLAHDPTPPTGDVRDSTWPPPEIPLTIRDSMEVTRRLGFRYLWVDRYCIPQVDISRRHEAISKMDQVYAGAVFTIVALDGDSVHAGLPGVSTRPRSKIQQALVRNGQLRWTFPSLSLVIDRSVWAMRGWTFQEFRLSRRCLFFTDYQVYFSCYKVTLSEALPQISSYPAVVRNYNARYDDQAIDSSGAGHKGFFLDRLKYTKKTLTYQNDILDAFRGIIGLHPYVTLWGIPITTVGLGWDLHPCVGFAMGLLWETRHGDDNEINGPKAFPRRRPGFPTWSWTSVLGQIHQTASGETRYRRFLEKSLGLHDHLAKKRKQPTFKVEELGQFVPYGIRSTKTEILRELPELSTSIFVEGDVLPLKKIKIGPYKALFNFCDWDGNVRSQRPLFARIDVTDPGAQPAATRKTLEDVQEALILVEWNDNQPKNKVRFVLMLLRWVDDRIAERVGLAGDYERSWDKRFVKSLSRKKHIKFELR